MAADMGIELKKTNVAAISLWPGAVETDTIQNSEHNANVCVFNHRSNAKYESMHIIF
jgi:short-subunit dehydrogenase